MKKIVVFFICSFVFFNGCSKKQTDEGKKYTDEEMTALINESGATIDKNVPAVNFADYVPGINKLTAKGLSYERLIFYALEFESEQLARAEATRLNQYYVRNWLFDRVEGEPILEDLVILKFHAINPKRSVQRKPVHVPKGTEVPAAH